MRKLLIGFTLIGGVCSAVPTPGTCQAAQDLYVSSVGSDTNPGTQSAPFLTIVGASKLAKPGATVHVAPGTYPGTFHTTANGTATARIRYVSDTKWGAKIVPPVNSTDTTAWWNSGNYIDIDGFDIDGTNYQNGTMWADGIYIDGSHTVVKNNHVHHIAQTVPCSNQGGGGIITDHYHYGINDDVVANVVHDLGPTGCTYIQGIYISTSGTVENNLVYNIAEAGIHLWHDATHVIIVNNTVVNNDSGILVGGGDFYHNTGPDDYTYVANNIAYGNHYAGIEEEGSTGNHNVYTNNLVYNNYYADYRLQNGLLPSNSVSSDPLFVKYGIDFSLKSGSPAIGKGTALNAPSTDINGVARRQSAGYDIGAYQFTSSSVCPSP